MMILNPIEVKNHERLVDVYSTLYASWKRAYVDPDDILRREIIEDYPKCDCSRVLEDVKIKLGI